MSTTLNHKIHILVANSSEAQCYETVHLGRAMHLVKHYTHPESQKKGHELVSDAPGHYKTSGESHGAFVPHTTPHEQEVEHFARELGDDLCHARNGHYDQLVIIAPAHFQGVLNKHFDNKVREKIIYQIEKDYTKLSQEELQNYLGKL